MRLPIPILDDRSYDQLRDELLRRAAVYTPEWTGRNDPSDPGVTLLELMAFLGENLLFRFNQIPDQTQLLLLRLLEVPPVAARSARGLVTFSFEGPRDTPAIEQGSTVLAGAIPFLIGNDVYPLPVSATAVIKAPAPLPQDPALRAEAQRALDAAALTSAERPELFTSDVLAADPAAPDFRPLDVSQAIDHTLWIAVRAESATLGELTRADGPLARGPLTLGIAGVVDYPALETVQPCPGADPGPERAPSAGAEGTGPEGMRAGEAFHWQVSTVLARADGLPEYLPLEVLRDSTDGLRRDGVLSLRLPPAELDRIGIAPLDDADLAGVGERPPVIAGGDPVLFWLRAFPRAGVPEIGRIRWVGLNAADVEQLADAAPEFLGTGTGMAHQELALAHDGVVPGSLVLQVEEHGQWVNWEVVDSLAASGRTDRHVVLDAPDGRIRSGDSVRGRTFPIGDRIRVLRYRYGGGRTGNVAAGAISTVAMAGTARVANPLPTTGGEDAESLERAMERIPGELGRHDRAVTAADFAELARIPGVARAECLPLFDPRTKSTDPATGRFNAAGVVSVMVWPGEDPRHPDAPQPDAGLLRAVCARLDARRLVTTELYVLPPSYHPVAVSVGLRVKAGASPVGVRRWVELVLRQYLAPLPPYGPEGSGWPLGHRVYGPELEAAVLQVEGVDFLEGLDVADLAGGVPRPGPVVLKGWEVPALTELTVVIGAPPPPGSGGVQPPQGPTPVPVPVPKAEC